MQQDNIRKFRSLPGCKQSLLCKELSLIHILSAFTSTQVTSTPVSAKHVPVTSPTSVSYTHLVIFFTSKLAENSEIIAMFSTGMSFKRMMRPYLISAAIISVVTFGLGAYVIPCLLYTSSYCICKPRRPTLK